MRPGANVIKLFTDVSYNFFDKIECLLLASLSRIVYCLQVRQEPMQVKHTSGAPLLGRLPALPKNIRLGWKGLPGANTLA
jgi:hypothetical protein